MSNGITLENKKQLIKKHPFFTSVEDKDIDVLLELSREVFLKKNSVIVKENDIIDNIYIIVDGVTEVTRMIETVDGHIPILLAKLSAGDIIGLSEVGFFSRTTRRTATVAALTDVMLLKLDAIEFSMFMLGSNTLSVDVSESADQIIRSNFIKKLHVNDKIISDHLAQLYSAIESVNVEPKEFIFRAGERDDNVYLLTKGKIDILDSQQNFLVTVQPAQLFGESGVLDLPIQTVTAVASEKSTILKLSRKSILQHARVETDSSSTTLTESSILRKTSSINVYKQISADSQCVYILTDDEKNYMFLNAVGWQLWQLIDDKNTLEVIVTEVRKQFNQMTQDDIVGFLSRLVSRKFLS